MILLRNLLGINKKNEHQMYLLLMKENKRKSTKCKSKLSNKRSLSKEYIRKHNKSHYQDIVGKICDFKLIKVENFKSNKLFKTGRKSNQILTPAINKGFSVYFSNSSCNSLHSPKNSKIKSNKSRIAEYIKSKPEIFVQNSKASLPEIDNCHSRNSRCTKTDDYIRQLLSPNLANRFPNLDNKTKGIGSNISTSAGNFYKKNEQVFNKLGSYDRAKRVH